MGVNTARIDTYAFALRLRHRRPRRLRASQVGNVGPDLGQGYIVDSFMVVVLGGVGQLAGTVYAALGLGVLNKLLEGWQGAVLAKIMVLVFIVIFIQKRPQGIFAMKGRSAESMSAAVPPSDLRAHAGAAMSAVLPHRRRSGPRPMLLRHDAAGLGVIAPRSAWSRVLVPVLNLVVPAGSAFHLSDYAVQLVAKIMCYAICALAMDLIWGYTGILSLGHGVFFALGGYAMGMYLMRQIGRDGHYQHATARLHGLPRLEGAPLALGAVATRSSRSWRWWCSCPGLLAFVFGFFAFRSRIKGVYFSIITQAMTFATMLLFFRNETGFGGNNGFTDFKRILGIPIATPSMRMTLFVHHRLHPDRLLPDRALRSSRSKFGRVLQAIRDAESRVMFTGYDPLALQARDLGHLGGDVRHRRRAVRAAGRHHQPGRDVAGGVDRDRDLGRGRRPRHADRADRRRVLRQRREELVHAGLPRVLALRARRACSSP